MGLPPPAQTAVPCVVWARGAGQPPTGGMGAGPPHRGRGRIPAVTGCYRAGASRAARRHPNRLSPSGAPGQRPPPDRPPRPAHGPGTGRCVASKGPGCREWCPGRTVGRGTMKMVQRCGLVELSGWRLPCSPRSTERPRQPRLPTRWPRVAAGRRHPPPEQRRCQTGLGPPPAAGWRCCRAVRALCRGASAGVLERIPLTPQLPLRRGGAGAAPQAVDPESCPTHPADALPSGGSRPSAWSLPQVATGWRHSP